MRAELPGATAIALMYPVLPSPSDALMLAHDGPVVAVFAVLTSVVRHSCPPPASMVLELLGSRMNGAMKFAVNPHASGIRKGTALVQLRLPGSTFPKIPDELDAPPEVFLWIIRRTYSP